MLYSQEVEREKRFKLAIRTGLPIFFLTGAIIFVVLHDQNFNLIDAVLILSTVFISVYYIFFMFYEGLSQKITDPVSKAFNREYILKILQKELNKKPKFTVVLISIDNLQDINERYGIEKGDKVLESFATIIDSFFRSRYKNIPIGHYKGGEFILGLEDSVESVREILDEFIYKYDKSRIDDIEIKLFATLTDSEYSKDIKKIVEYLYELYSAYLYRPKSKRVMVASKKSMKADEFEKFIVKSIENKELSIRFQPALSLKEENYDLVEIVVKLIGEEGNLIHPSQFIPVINRLGYEQSFDLVLTEKILESIVVNDLPKDILYSFNVSPFSLRDGKFLERIRELFSRYEVPKSSIVFELYENRLYRDVDHYKKILDIYKNMGFKIAFDNFGSLNASLEYVKEIGCDFVHFDKYFTKNIDNEIYRDLLESWIIFFHKNKTKCIVKFVDKKENIEIFRKLGADYVEGYAISEPLTAEDLIRFIKERL